MNYTYDARKAIKKEGMGRMRLGIDASNLREGGGVTHLGEILRALNPSMYNIENVVVWSGQQTLRRLPAQPWLTLATDRYLNQSLIARLYWQKFTLPSLVRKNCDVLFAPGGSYLGDFRPYVTMSQNMLPFERMEYSRYGLSLMFLKFNLLRLQQSASFRNANGMIFLTEYAQNVVIKHIKKFLGDWKIIPHGISQSFFQVPRPARAMTSFSQTAPFRLLYISNVYPYKHQWNVAKAVHELRRAGLCVELNLAGTAYPPALKRLRKVIQQVDPQEQFIHYHGGIPYDEVAQWYFRADGFVFASSCENFSITLLEAMAAGLPIACSNRGPMPSILGEAGIYFDPEQLDSIVSALAHLIQDKNWREQHAYMAYQRAQDYSWERCTRETFDFISLTARRYWDNFK